MPVDEPKPASWQFHWHESSFVTSPYLRFIHLHSHTFSFLCFRCRIEQSSQEQRNKQICSAPKLCVGSGEIENWNALPHISGVVRDLVELLNPRREVDSSSSDACVWAGEGAKKEVLTVSQQRLLLETKQATSIHHQIQDRTRPPSANSYYLQIELLAASICGFDFTL
jgi:hypothetical protein